jgi:hypothetical protein
VWVDEAGENQLTAGIDNFRAWWSIEILPDAGDSFAFDVDVRMKARANGYNLAIPD